MSGLEADPSPLLPREDLSTRPTTWLAEQLAELESGLRRDGAKLAALRRLRDIAREVAAENTDDIAAQTEAKATRRYELFRDEFADRKSMIRRLHDELAFRTLLGRDVG